MTLSRLLTTLSIVAVSAARMVVHESRSAAPSGFVSHGAAPTDNILTLRVALAPNNIAGLEEKLTSLSTPGSSEFRQWLSMDEVKSFVAPSVATVTTFDAWAFANGLKPTVISPNGDWLSITLPVSQANALFAANFEVFSHPEITGDIVRTLSVSLPSELVGHVDVLHPTTVFVEPNLRLAPAINISVDEKHAPPASCNVDSDLITGVITPACLQSIYGIPRTPATEKSNTLLVTGYVGQYAQSADLSAFLKLLRPDIPSNTTFMLLTTDNGTNPQDPADAGIEADLDIEYATGIATGVPIKFLSVGSNLSNLSTFVEGLLDTTTFLDGVAQPPSVMTTSYATTESFFGNSMATKICHGYMALSSRGVSVVFASGDGGVWGNRDTIDVCANKTFTPAFPASCPFVLSVGSTQGLAPEKAINFTGGGFSDFFPTPSYQAAAVAGFLKTVPTNFTGIFNKSGRGYPDVALQGWNFQVVTGGVSSLTGGTSASAPTFAGILALINDRLRAAGKPSLGFLNPFIYSKASNAFTDVTIGHNSGFVCPASTPAFDAAVGWDPLTGLGTPIFPKLLAAALE
ncbi:family S53 protease-like protein [Mycena metata]|uniref:tripeptidyl-peptidase II n=1 Tax=Mycena metata TaxID=1033252 RepID=A0AAD7NKK4_9AGAR|nr:family S53 protease-like protein [Mycena metata]